MQRPRPLPRPVLVQLTKRFRTTLAQISATASPQMQAAWAQLADYNEAQIAEFTRLAHPIVAAAKTSTVRTSAAYYSLAAGIRPPSLTARDVGVEPDLRGPFIQTWSALKNGAARAGAIAAGASRAEAMITNFVASASRQTGAAVYDKAGVEPQGWQREPEPDACEWCLEMSEHTYSSAEATDFGHDRCSCIGVPAF